MLEMLMRSEKSPPNLNHAVLRPKKPNVDVLQGLERLATVLPQKSKFPKARYRVIKLALRPPKGSFVGLNAFGQVVKLLYRWTKA